MNILVVGRGWTGQKVLAEFARRGHTVSLTSHDQVQFFLAKLPFDFVVNCAGVTGSPNVDACEDDKLGTIDGNAIFPIMLSNLCDMYGVRLAHFSSGCIYVGNIDSADADPNFFGSIYSTSKGVSDLYLKDKAIVMRIRMPFTGVNEPKNYLTKVLKYAKTAKLIDAGENSLTDHDEAVKVACDLVEENVPNGPYNLVNGGTINMHDLADLLGIAPEWFTPEEFKAATAAGRSTCTIPDSGRMRPIREALTEAIAKMKT